MRRWPESIWRAVLVCRPEEVPTIDMVRDDPKQAKRDHAALLAAIDEYREEHRVCCDAIGMPCESDGEAHKAAMSRLRRECTYSKDTAPLMAREEALRLGLHDKNAESSIAKAERIHALRDNLTIAGVVIGPRMSADDWSLADPDGRLWCGLSTRQIERDKTEIRNTTKG